MGLFSRWKFKNMKFPYVTIIEKRYRNLTYPYITRGGFFTEEITTQQGYQKNKYFVYKVFHGMEWIIGILIGAFIGGVGAFILNNLFIIPIGFGLGLLGGWFATNSYVKIPDLPISFLNETPLGKTIKLLQISEKEYLPMSYIEGNEMVIVDEINDQGEKVEKQIMLTPTTIALQNGHVVQIPFVVPNKVYSKEEAHIIETHSDMAYYTKNRGWEKYLPLISGIVIIGILFLIVVFGSQELTKMMSAVAQSNAEVSYNIALVTSNQSMMVTQMAQLVREMKVCKPGG